DGVWLAYRTEQALMLHNAYSGENTRIDAALAGVPPVRGQGDTIAWSPAGDALAVTTETGGRVYFNAESNPSANQLYTAVDLTEGPFIQVMWSPDGRYLAAEAFEDVWWLYRREDDRLLLTSAIPSSDGLAWYNETTVAFAPAEGGLRLMDLNAANARSEEHTSELQSRENIVCRLLLEKKKSNSGTIKNKAIASIEEGRPGMAPTAQSAEIATTN